MLEFISQHQFGIAVAAYWLFSAAVSSLPEPMPGGSAAYLWLYRFCHTTAGNITTAFGSKIPGLKTVAGLLLLTAAFSTTGCALHYTVHPGALNPTDSAAYDTLLMAQTAIDTARTQPDSSESKTALNTLIGSYNVARESWLTWRGAIVANQPSDAYLAQLNKNLTDLRNAIRALNGKGVK